MDGCGCGVRSRLYPKPPYVHPEWPPETVTVSGDPGAIAPGPADERMHVLNPINKRIAYGANIGPLGTPFINLPPWKGADSSTRTAGRDGNFDRIPKGPRNSPRRTCSAVSASCSTSGRTTSAVASSGIFARDFPRLEIVISPEINNSYAGYGYLEVGAEHRRDGSLISFALNFDVVAHELGHLIIYSTIGVPSLSAQQGEYYGFQESGGRHHRPDLGAAFRKFDCAPARGDGRQSLHL